MQKLSHLDPKTQEVVWLDNATRILHLKQPVWIDYPRAKKLIQILDDLMAYPKRSRMPNLLIIGESFMGKTSVIEKFVSTHRRVLIKDEEGMPRALVPVVMISAPDMADMKNVYIKILEEFPTGFRPNDTLAKLRHQALYMMRDMGVEMLIIDEIHNLLETTMTKQRLVMNGIKNLSNELKIPIVGAGTSVAVKILSTDPQHASRFDVVRLGKWELNQEYRGLLKAFEKRLPLRKPSHLYQKEKAKLLYTLSNGNLGNLHKLITACAIEAIESETEEITLEIIRNNQWVRPPSEGMAVEISLG